jgi:hypothetical protein
MAPLDRTTIRGQSAVHRRRNHGDPSKEQGHTQAFPVHSRTPSACSSDPSCGQRLVLAVEQKATRGDPAAVGVGKHSKARAALLDLRHLILTLASRPTHVSELVEYDPELAGTCDASAARAGGVWIGYNVQPTVWRLEWPQDVVDLYREQRSSLTRTWRWRRCSSNI